MEGEELAGVVATRLKALPWGIRIGARMLAARLRREAALHDAAAQFVRAHATEGEPQLVLAELDHFAREQRAS
jgi:hypothetical protein|tara:strand:- start:693 stop:911 length:219 start_codon:yes stop_codon:yes gene_type:complete